MDYTTFLENIKNEDESEYEFSENIIYGRKNEKDSYLVFNESDLSDSILTCIDSQTPTKEDYSVFAECYSEPVTEPTKKTLIDATSLDKVYSKIADNGLTEIAKKTNRLETSEDEIEQNYLSKGDIVKESLNVCASYFM